MIDLEIPGFGRLELVDLVCDYNGTLAQDGYTAYATHPYIIVVPSICIAWLILSAFFIADGLRDALDPRTKET